MAVRATATGMCDEPSHKYREISYLQPVALAGGWGHRGGADGRRLRFSLRLESISGPWQHEYECSLDAQGNDRGRRSPCAEGVGLDRALDRVLARFGGVASAHW